MGCCSYIGGLKSVQRILGRNWIDDSTISVRLLTDTNELNNFNSETIQLFGIRGEIRNLPGLHAKIYILDDYYLITSANLTNTAFTKRHEIGIFLDEVSSKNAISIFERWWNNSKEVSTESLIPTSRRVFTFVEETQGLKLPSLWTLPEDPVERNYWFKPIGSKENPITEDRIFDQIQDRLHFANVKPKGVKVGDFLIAYGIGARRILSIYEVLSPPVKMMEAEMEEVWQKRWPWYVTGKNLTPNFGQRWAKHDIYADNLVADFLRQNSDGVITKVGGKTLGA